MNIKNYTSSVPVTTTIARLEEKLAAAGASHISKTIGPDRSITALIFSLDRAGGKPVQIKVPANIEECYNALWKSHCLSVRSPREGSKQTIREQAARTAWRLVQDWVEVQISLIVMRQAEPLQVFLPYVWDGRQTFFESLKSGGFKALPEHVE